MWKFFFFLPIYPIYGKKIFIALISRFFMEKRAQHIHEIIKGQAVVWFGVKDHRALASPCSEPLGRFVRR
jgi:hypothetical protein